MLNFEETNALGQILNVSWGSPGKGISHNLQGDILVLRYQTIVHFASERALSLQTGQLAEESVQLLKDKITEIKKQFKDLTGNTLKLKEQLNRDAVDLIQASSLNPRKVAYYRRFVEFIVEN